VFLVDIRIKPVNNIKIYLDGDQGLSIERLVQYNRRLYKQLEEENLYPNGDFSLELSSPGLEEPLKLRRQYNKNVGRYLDVVDNEGNKHEGKLLAVNDEEIQLEQTSGKGKKLVTTISNIPLTNIKTATVQIKF
jgi:ribosome maturation factor RimP